jgi:hypothetical protein
MNQYDTPFDKTNKGALFKANNKRSEESPDYLGNLNVEGKEWSVFGRIKKAQKSGKTYMALSIAPPRNPAPQPQRPPEDPFNDDDF